MLLLMIIIKFRKKNYNNGCEYYNFDRNYLILLNIEIMYAIRITLIDIVIRNYDFILT